MAMRMAYENKDVYLLIRDFNVLASAMYLFIIYKTISYCYGKNLVYTQPCCSVVLLLFSGSLFLAS